MLFSLALCKALNVLSNLAMMNLGVVYFMFLVLGLIEILCVYSLHQMWKYFGHYFLKYFSFPPFQKLQLHIYKVSSSLHSSPMLLPYVFSPTPADFLSG